MHDRTVLGSGTKMRNSGPPFCENSANAQVEASAFAMENGNLMGTRVVEEVSLSLSLSSPRARANRSGVPGPSWLIDGTLVVPDDAATDIGHAVGGRAGLDQ